MRRIELKETKIYMGQMVSIKAQFEVKHPGKLEDKVFTYTYSEIGVVGLNGNQMPEQLQFEATNIELTADIRHKELDDIINTKKTVFMPLERRSKSVKYYDGAYVRHSYGYAVCYVTDKKEMEQMAELMVGDMFKVQNKPHISPAKEEGYLYNEYEVINKCAISDSNINEHIKDKSIPFESKILGIVFELKQIPQLVKGDKK